MFVSDELRRQVRRYEPCLPRLAKAPPAGSGWIHEIKHDGFRILAELNAGDVKLITRKGFDLAQRFPLATAAIAALPARSCIVDSEAIACDANGLSVFDLLRYRRQDDAVTLCAFDLLELDGVDLRREPIEVRKRTLSRLLRRKHAGISFNRHFDVEGDHLPARLCARLRRHRVEAAGLTLSTGSAGLLDQSQKPGSPSGAARGRRRLGLMADRRFRCHGRLRNTRKSFIVHPGMI